MLSQEERKAPNKTSLIAAVLFLLGCVVVAMYHNERGSFTSSQLTRKSAISSKVPACAVISLGNRVDCGYPGITQSQCEGRGCCWVMSSSYISGPQCFLPMDNKGSFVVVPPPVSATCTAKATAVFYKYAQLRALMDLNVKGVLNDSQFDVQAEKIVQPVFQITPFGSKATALKFSKEILRIHENNVYSEVHHFCTLVSVVGCNSWSVTIEINIHAINKDRTTGARHESQDIEAVTWNYNKTVGDYLLAQIVANSLPVTV